jgi:hypothetical protein
VVYLAIIHVPSDYPTVQEGIDAASSGDTVLVAPGIYEESIVIAKALTLRATGPNTVLNGNSVTENYYMVTIASSDVTVDGFEITNPLYNGTADASGIVTISDGPQSNVNILNNHIYDIGRMDRPQASFGTFGINSGGVERLTVQRNKIQRIGNNDSREGDFGFAVGIFVYSNSEQALAKDVKIDNNDILNIVSPKPVNDGINIGAENAEITQNRISAVKRGIAASASSEGRMRVVSNRVSDASVVGVLLRGSAEKVVSYNTIENNAVGIIIDPPSTPPAVKFNNIVGNNVGIQNNTANTVTAEDNWWGTPNGPQPGDLSGPVDATPFLAQPVPAINPSSVTYTTGPMVADRSTMSLVVQCENTTTEQVNTIVNLYDLTKCPKVLQSSRPLQVNSNSANFILLPQPPTSFEIEIIGMVDGMTAWIGGRTSPDNISINSSSFLSQNMWNQNQLVAKEDVPSLDQFTVTTGPVVNDNLGRSLIVQVLNNTNTAKTVHVTIYNLTTTQKTVRSVTTLSIQPNCSAFRILPTPPIQFEVSIDGMTDEMYAMTVNRPQVQSAAINLSNLLAQNEFRSAEFTKKGD